MTEIPINELTAGTLDGAGIYDVLMRTTKVHLDQEYNQNRIRGPEYSQVYLGSMEAAMRVSLDFLTQRRKIALEAQLLTEQITLVHQQGLNAVTEGEVLTQQVCKLKAEYDLLILQKERVSAETALLTQKLATEKAQTVSLGVDVDSVVGRQKSLYLAQTNGFTRDAEQKVAKLMVDTWNVRRTTDEGTVADGTNMLSDAVVGRAVNKMLAGVGA